MGVTTIESFGQQHFATADLGHQARVLRLVETADRLVRQPGGTFPDKLPDPADLKGLYRLLEHPTLTHASVLAAATLIPPRQQRGEERGVPLPLWVVRVAEVEPPAGVEPLEWILLTNVPVGDAAAAWQCADWYAVRWVCEEYHKAQKTGCGIEALQFRHRDRLEPAIALLSVVALTLLELRDLSRQPQARSQRAVEVLPWARVRLLSRWRHREERPDWTVWEFYYALARLGGHQNRKHDHPPGWLVLWRGWTKLQTMLAGAAAAGTG